MALKRYRFRIVGLCPILMNNPGGMKKPGDDAGMKVKKVPLPDEEAAGLVYAFSNGQLYGPAMGFRSALIAAATGRKIGKRPAPGLLKGAVFCPVDVEKVPLFHPKTGRPLTTKDYTVDSRRCVLTNNGKKVGVVRSRPRVEEWACEVELEIDDDFVDVATVAETLDLAGRTKGYLDFRPQCGGSFGRFKAELVADEPAQKAA